MAGDHPVPAVARRGVARGGAAGRTHLRWVPRPVARWRRCGSVPYAEALALQERLHAARVAGRVPDTFLFLEHPPVLTLGRAADPRHVVADPETLARRGIAVVPTTRGGDVTYHGPGQLVVYGIVDLRPRDFDVHGFMRRLEGAVIACLADYGIAAGRDPEHPGVWCGPEKICAVGVGVRSWVTFHGLALNVDPDLSPFELIVPCGIAGRGVSSMARRTGRPVAVDDVAPRLATHLAREFGYRAMVLED